MCWRHMASLHGSLTASRGMTSRDQTTAPWASTSQSQRVSSRGESRKPINACVLWRCGQRETNAQREVVDCAALGDASAVNVSSSSGAGTGTGSSGGGGGLSKNAFTMAAAKSAIACLLADEASAQEKSPQAKAEKGA